MTNCYLDSSALVKYYHAEVGSVAVMRYVEDATVRCLISRLAVTEVHSAFAQKLRTGDIDETEFERLWEQFEDDVKRSQFAVVRVLERHHDEAERLLRRYARGRLRTLDALQLAVGLDLHHRTPLDQFVCADTRLCETAGAEGLSVVNPAQS